MDGVPIDRLALRMHKTLVMIDTYYHRTLKQIAEELEEGKAGTKEDASLLPPSGSLPS